MFVLCHRKNMQTLLNEPLIFLQAIVTEACLRNHKFQSSFWKTLNTHFN